MNLLIYWKHCHFSQQAVSHHIVETKIKKFGSTLLMTSLKRIRLLTTGGVHTVQQQQQQQQQQHQKCYW